jgi:hypothetical protein
MKLNGFRRFRAAPLKTKYMYKKIYIVSESDLPAEGEYFCMLKNGTPAQCSFELIVVEWWMENIDWYFQTIPEQSEPSDEELYNIFGEWTVKTFPDAGSVEHLKKLIIETYEAINDPFDISEYADCLGAIFGASFKAKFSYKQLMTAFREKFEINKTRKWEKKSNGMYQHIKDNESFDKLPDRELRKEIIKFGIWVTKNDYSLKNGNITETVIEYLKTL